MFPLYLLLILNFIISPGHSLLFVWGLQIKTSEYILVIDRYKCTQFYSVLNLSNLPWINRTLSLNFFKNISSP